MTDIKNIEYEWEQCANQIEALSQQWVLAFNKRDQVAMDRIDKKRLPLVKRMTKLDALHDKFLAGLSAPMLRRD